MELCNSRLAQLSTKGPLAGPFSQLSTSSVNIRPRKLEGVLDQFQLRFGAFGHQHFHHVEPEENIRIIEQPQPGQAALRDAPLLVPMHRCQRTPEILAATRFDFHEHQRVLVAANDVDLAAAPPAKIAIEHLVTVPA